MSDEQDPPAVEKGGRPPKYRKAFAKQAELACELGFIDTQLAELFGVDVRTVHRWKKLHPEFAAALDGGKDVADEKVKLALFKRAIGYSHRAVKILAVSDGAGAGSSVEKVPYTERYAPDTMACIYWLNNRDPANWRQKNTTELEAGATLEQLLTRSREIPQPPGPAPESSST